MKQYTCKKCNKKNKILPEWGQINEPFIVVSCEHCGNKARYRPKASEAKQEEKEHNNTVIFNTNKESGKRFLLDIIKGVSGQKNHKIILKKNDYTIYIGRSPKQKAPNKTRENDEFFVINDPYVSRLHAILTVKVGQEIIKIQVQDNNSVNGVLVNGDKLLQEDIVWVNKNDIIEIGETILKLKEG